MDAAPVPLLRTKPCPRHGLVSRPRLAERIAGSGSRALTLVSAAADFGTTTL